MTALPTSTVSGVDAASVLDDLADGVLALDPQLRVRLANTSAAALLGAPSAAALTDRPVEDVLPTLGRDVLLAAAGGPALPFVATRTDGRLARLEILVRAQRAAQGFVVTLREAPAEPTRNPRSEHQHRLHRTFEALTTLAGGLAHDLNNVLATIFMCAEMTLRDQNLGEDARVNIEEILASGLRARGVLQQLQTLDRKRTVTRRLLDAHRCISEAVWLLRSTLPPDIEVRTHLDERAGFILADPSDIQQVVTQLGLNAAQAMPKGGVLTVELARVTLDREAAAELVTLTPGDYVALHVQDTGVGIDRADHERIFDPFFTTQTRSDAAGMGLTAVYAIVRACAGTVTVDSAPGVGTRFTILLPAG